MADQAIDLPETKSAIALPGANPDPLLVRDLAVAFNRFMWWTDQQDGFVVAVWALFSHVVTKVPRSPRLFIDSPTYECGKTTLEDLLSLFVSNPRVFGAGVTEAAIIRAPSTSMDKGVLPTLILDEADTWLKDAKSPMVGMLNAGFGPARNAYVPRFNQKTQKLDYFPVYCAVAFASRGKEPPGGLARRSVRVRLEKAPPAKLPPELNEKNLPVADILALQGRIGAWAKWAGEHISHEELKGVRFRDTWGPMFDVARLFGLEAELLAVVDSKNLLIPEEDNVAILRNVYALFEKRSADCLPTEALVTALIEDEDAMWAWLEEKFKTPQSRKKWLSKQLEAFSIKPDDKPLPRAEGKRQRGYWRDAFTKAWTAHGIGAEAGAGTDSSPSAQGLSEAQTLVST